MGRSGGTVIALALVLLTAQFIFRGGESPPHCWFRVQGGRRRLGVLHGYGRRVHAYSLPAFADARAGPGRPCRLPVVADARAGPGRPCRIARFSASSARHGGLGAKRPDADAVHSPIEPEASWPSTPLMTWVEGSRDQEGNAEGGGADYPCRITKKEYLGACPNGFFERANLRPTESDLEALLAALGTEGSNLGLYNYFLFLGEDREHWDPRFNARLAYEGFFTITTSRWGPRQPLPELQPYYSVLLWKNFERSKSVRKAIRRLRRSGSMYRLRNSADPVQSWSRLNKYHLAKDGANWLTFEYFEMLQAASKDPTINFKLQCIELCEIDEHPAHQEGQAAATPAPKAQLFDATSIVPALRRRAAGRVVGDPQQQQQPQQVERQLYPLAGEIGFSIGNVYTSLSGWTGRRTADSFGTAQLVLLGRWLQKKGCKFWSLGHPEMDYKRVLGHRVYPRRDFLALLKQHRGEFATPQGGPSAGSCCAMMEGECIAASALIAPAGSANCF